MLWHDTSNANAFFFSNSWSIRDNDLPWRFRRLRSCASFSSLGYCSVVNRSIFTYHEFMLFHSYLQDHYKEQKSLQLENVEKLGMVYCCNYRIDIIIVTWHFCDTIENVWTLGLWKFPRYRRKKRANKLQVYEVAIARILEKCKSVFEDTGKENCDRLTGF